MKILSHIATAAQIHLMLGFKEQLKALLQQLRGFDVREMDIPPDLEHSPRINTVVWRLTCRALYSLDAEIHTASMTVPLSLLSPPLPSFIHCFFFLPLRCRLEKFVSRRSLHSLSLSLPLILSLSLSPSCPLSWSLFTCKGPFEQRGCALSDLCLSVLIVWV